MRCRQPAAAKVFEEKASGAQRERPALKAALDYMRAGDTLVVWKLLYSGKTVQRIIFDVLLS